MSRATARDLLRTSTATRLVGVDVARCVALIAMMATHMLPELAPDGGLTLSHELFGGRASGLFAVLAGVSMALVTGGARPHRGVELAGDASGLVARSLVVGTLGLWLGGLDTRIAVILTYYALLFLLGLPFLRLPAWALAVLALLWTGLGPVVSHGWRQSVPDPDYAVPSGENLHSLGALAQNLFLTGYYPAFTWLAYLLAGMAAGRLDLRRLRSAAVLAVTGAVLAVGAKAVSSALLASGAAQSALLASWDRRTVDGWAELQTQIAGGLFGVTPTGSWWWLATSGPHSGTPLDLAHTTGTALMVLGVCLLLARAAPRGWQIAFGAGAMTLSLYSLHIIMLTPDVWPTEGPASYAPQVFVVMVTGAVFAAARLRGPLETVVRAASKVSAAVARGGHESPQ